MASDSPKLGFELLLLVLLACLWGSSYMLIKIAVTAIPPITLVAMRAGIAALFLLLVMRLRGRQLPRDTGTWKMLLVQSFLTGIGPWLVLTWGQKFVDSGLAGVLNSTSPIFVFFYSLLLFGRDSATAQKLVGALLGIIGVAMIIGVDVLSGIGQDVIAQLAILSGAAMYGWAAIYGRQFAEISPLTTSAGVMILTAVILTPISLIVDQPWNLTFTFEPLVALVILAIFCTGTALLLYFRLVKTLGSMGVASQAYLRSGVSVLLGTLILGEHLSPSVFVGLTATILGVALINVRFRGRASA
jgi:drug/metabolite transporter (DMT)-like permease